jgi:hypothetical protein
VQHRVAAGQQAQARVVGHQVVELGQQRRRERLLADPEVGQQRKLAGAADDHRCLP